MKVIVGKFVQRIIVVIVAVAAILLVAACGDCQLGSEIPQSEQTEFPQSEQTEFPQPEEEKKKGKPIIPDVLTIKFSSESGIDIIITDADNPPAQSDPAKGSYANYRQKVPALKSSVAHKFIKNRQYNLNLDGASGTPVKFKAESKYHNRIILVVADTANNKLKTVGGSLPLLPTNVYFELITTKVSSGAEYPKDKNGWSPGKAVVLQLNTVPKNPAGFRGQEIINLRDHRDRDVPIGATDGTSGPIRLPNAWLFSPSLLQERAILIVIALYTSGLGWPDDALHQDRWRYTDIAHIDVFSDALLGKEILVKMTLRGQGVNTRVTGDISVVAKS